MCRLSWALSQRRLRAIRYLALLHPHILPEIRVLVAHPREGSLVNDVILLNFELPLIHQAQLLVLDLDALVSFGYVLQRVGALALHIGHFEHVLLIIGLAAGGQEDVVGARF